MWRSQTNSPSVTRGSTQQQQPTRSSSISILPSNKGSLLQRAISLQFLNRSRTEKEERAKIRLRYMDISKKIIWPTHRYSPDLVAKQPQLAPLADMIGQRQIPVRQTNVVVAADMEDEHSPYLTCAINQVLRSDSEDSSDEIVHMTRL